MSTTIDTEVIEQSSGNGAGVKTTFEQFQLAQARLNISGVFPPPISHGVYRNQSNPVSKDAIVDQIAKLVALAKKKGAGFNEIHEATVKAYGTRAAKKAPKGA
jgi:hypothetical protein